MKGRLHFHLSLLCVLVTNAIRMHHCCSPSPLLSSLHITSHNTYSQDVNTTMKRNTDVQELLDNVAHEHRHAFDSAVAQLVGGVTVGLDLRMGGLGDIHGNGIYTSFSDGTVAALSQWLGKGVKLAHLLLDDHDIDDAQLRSLLQGVAKNEHLDELSLVNTMVTDAAPFVTLLADNNSLTKIRLEGTEAIEDEHTVLQLSWLLMENQQPLRLKYLLKQFADVLVHRDPVRDSAALSVLDLDDRGGAKQYNDVSVKLLISAMLGCKPSDGVIKENGKAFDRTRLKSQNRVVTSIILSRSVVTAKGASLLASYLPLDACLVKLDLSNSTAIGSAGVKQIVRSMTPPGGNIVIEELNISNTGCSGEKCGSHIAKMITTHEALSVLRLSHNNFKGCGKIFVKAQYISTSLRILDIKHCGIEDEYLEQVKESEQLHETPQCVIVSIPKLHANCPLLTHLDCSADLESDSAINDKSLLLLIESLHGNGCLEYLNLTGNSITYIGFCDLVRSLSMPGAATNLSALVVRKLCLAPGTAQQMESGTYPVRKMCELINAHPKLAKVDLSENFVEEDAGEHALLCAKKVAKLIYFGFEGTEMPYDVVVKVSQLLTLHRYPPPFANLTTALWESGVEGTMLDFSAAGPWWGNVIFTSCMQNGVCTIPIVADDVEVEEPIDNTRSTSDAFLREQTSSVVADKIDPFLEFKQRDSVTEEPTPIKYLGYPDRPQEVSVENAFAVLCEVLQHETCFTHIDVSGHNLGDSGVAPLFLLLSQNPSLVGLSLNNTGITSAGAHKLVGILQEDHTVCACNISDNPRVSAHARELVEAHLKFNATPSSLKDLFVKIRANCLEEVVFKGDGTAGSDLTDTWFKCIVDTIVQSTTGEEAEDESDAFGKAVRNSRKFSHFSNSIHSNHSFLGGSVVGGVDGFAEQKVARCNSVVRKIDVSDTFVTTDSLDHLTVLLDDPYASYSVKKIILRNCMLSGTKHLATFLDAAAGKSIELVDLSHNYLGIAGFKEISSALGRHDTLGEVLLVSDDMIDTDKHADVNRQLVLGKELNKHPNFKNQIARIKKMDASVTEIKERGCSHHLTRLLSNVVHLSVNLVKIDFSNGEIEDKAAGFIAKTIHIESPIRFILLSHNSITSVGARLLASAIEGTQVVEQLWLDDNDIDGRGANAFIQALYTNTSLLDLRMEDNSKIPAILLAELSDHLLNDQLHLKEILPLIQNGDTDMKVVDLSEHPHNNLSIRCILKSVPGNISIVTINLSNSPILEEGVRNIGYIVTSCLTIKELILDNCAIDDNGAEVLFTAISHNQGLRLLSLKDNLITCKPIPLLTAAIDLSGCGSLYEVLIQGNPVTAVHGQKGYDIENSTVLAELQNMLEFNNVPVSLKKVINDLRSNLIKDLQLRGVGVVDAPPEASIRKGTTELHGNRTAMILATAFPRYDTIRTVDLSYNSITDEGAKSIAEVLPDSKNITALNLRNNGVGDAGLLALRNALMRCYSLKALNLSENAYSDAKCEAEMKLLLECNSHPHPLKKYVVAGLQRDAIPEIKVDGEICKNIFRDTQKPVLDATEGFTTDAERNHFVAAFDLPTVHETLTDASIRLVTAHLTRHSNLSVISLPNNSITHIGVECLYKTLLTLDTVEEICLAGNDIADEGGVLLCKLARQKKAIRSINLRGNCLTDVAAQHFLKYMQVLDTTLDVNLKDNSGISERRHTDIDLLLELNHKSRSMKELMVSLLDGGEFIQKVQLECKSAHDFFDDERGFVHAQHSLSFLLQFLAMCSTVRSLDLSRNGIREMDVVQTYLHSALYLREFTMNDTSMSSVEDAAVMREPGVVKLVNPGTMRLFKTLQYSINLTVVNLVSCGLGDEISPHILPIIGNSFVLETLNLSENWFTELSIKKVADRVSTVDTIYALKNIFFVPSSYLIPEEVFSLCPVLTFKRPEPIQS